MKKVIDTEALLAFYLGETGADKVEQILIQSHDGSLECFLNIVNLSEFYYILARKSEDIAEEKERNLRGFGVKVVPVDDDSLWREAARIKASYSLSLADAFAVATAMVLKADLVAGLDRELRGVGVKIERIR
jgi:predicted nucleic acid-binding protein